MSGNQPIYEFFCDAHTPNVFGKSIEWDHEKLAALTIEGASFEVKETTA